LDGHEDVLREYAFSSLVVAQAAISAIERLSPSRIYMSHGTYVDWGPALHIALSRNIPVTAWMASYLKSRFFFRHIEDALRIDFHNLSETAWENCMNSPLTHIQQGRLDGFLQSRYLEKGSFDMKHLKDYNGDIDAIRSRYVLDDRPVWGIISHINWDAVSDYSPMAHECFDDWIVDTVNEIIKLPDIQWLIKIHPAEAWDNPESGVHRLIQARFPSLPPHVKVIPADDDISPLDFFNLIDGAVTVYGTSGLEIAIQGKPVILSGEAHYGRRGFTYDGLSPESYRELLRKVRSIKPLSGEQVELARKYAYCYFIQRQIPMSVVNDPTSEWWSFQFDRRHLLLPGRDPYMDFICDRIMDGRDFIMDDRLVALAEEM
jgi:hypothetical protein